MAMPWSNPWQTQDEREALVQDMLARQQDPLVRTVFAEVMKQDPHGEIYVYPDGRLILVRNIPAAGPQSVVRYAANILDL
jgi:hypothetical protein